MEFIDAVLAVYRTIAERVDGATPEKVEEWSQMKAKAELDTLTPLLGRSHGQNVIRTRLWMNVLRRRSDLHPVVRACQVERELNDLMTAQEREQKDADKDATIRKQAARIQELEEALDEGRKKGEHN